MHIRPSVSGISFSRKFSRSGHDVPSGRLPSFVKAPPYIHTTFSLFSLLSVVVAVQPLSHVRLFTIPWTIACQASLSCTISWSFLKLMSMESMMPSNHFILWCPHVLVSSVFPSIRVFSFPVSWLFTSVVQSIRASALASVFPMNILD